MHVKYIVSLKARQDITLSVKFADDVPPMRIEYVALDLDILEHSGAPATITRPETGDCCFSSCVEQCSRLHVNLDHWF